MSLFKNAALSLCLVLGVAAPTVTFSTVASADAKDDAEVVRLTAEMKKHLSKNQYGGADADYVAILKLKHVTIPADVHFLGGQAARGAYRVGDAFERFTKGSKGGSADATKELEALKTRFGQIDIDKQKKENRKLTITELPFDPLERATFDAVKAIVEDKGKYEGWLPVGEYTLGSKTFTIKGGAATVKVK